MTYKLEKKVKEYIQCFIKMIKIRNIRLLVYFLDVRVIYNIEEKRFI